MKSHSTLNLFNAVRINKGIGHTMILPEYGIIVDHTASHEADIIKSWAKTTQLTGSQLNSTFHKSWAKVINSTREELLIDQIYHYLTTYGTGHSSSFVYVPSETLNVPSVELTFKVIRGLTDEELRDRALDLFKSGVALKEETITELFAVFAGIGYVFTGNEEIKNKEALCRLCELTGNIPNDPIEFVRYLVYLATGKSLLIKNKEIIQQIKNSNKNTDRIANAIMKCDAKSVAKVFNRVKPILIAFKHNDAIFMGSVRTKINKISRMSKKLHEPMPRNVLNNIGTCAISELRENRENLMNANFFQLARCLNFLCENRQNFNDSRVYSIRNGKFFATRRNTANVDYNLKINFIINLMNERFSQAGKKIFIPEGVDYALPTSEKNFVGNIPMGTRLSSSSLAAGIYWEVGGGAVDLDLSAISINNKVGWNRSYNTGELVYSGDMTYADPCATEYVFVAAGKLSEPHLVMNNVFSGDSTGSKFSIIVGKGDNINNDYMMDPNKVWFSAQTETISRQSVIGIMLPDKNKQTSFVVMNASFGGSAVSGNSDKNTILREALVHKWTNCVRLIDVLYAFGATLVDSPHDEDVIDLTPSKLDKDTIINLFK